MRVAVIGAGYVGLVTGAGLARTGHEVVLAESNPDRLAMLRRGKAPFYEPGLDDLLAEGLAAGSVKLVGSGREAVIDAEVVVIALPTPQASTGAADTSIVEVSVREFVPHLASNAIVALKSTMPTEGFDRLRTSLSGGAPGIHLVVNPEFLREGSAVADFFAPDRIVIGSDNEAATEQMAKLYAELGAPLVVTDPVSAAMVKYAANAYLATRVSFVNAIANVCEAVGANVRDVLLGLGFDQRIGFHFLSPGPGFGGSCLPKDTQALVNLAAEGGYDFALLRGVIEVNEQQARRVVSKVRDGVGGDLASRRIGIWGLAFKAGTDDVRDSPALRIARGLAAEGAQVRAYDPRAETPPDLDNAPTALDSVAGADALVILTEWPEFQNVDLAAVRAAMSGTLVVDARNLLDPDAVRRHGLRYVGVGR